jgi:hypothetical protein
VSEPIAALVARAAELVAEVTAETYRDDPFWDDRYGARGRRYTTEDGQYHVTYLAEALRANDPAIIERYATWLRSVLTSRGMCSRHLVENLERLGGAIARAGLDVNGTPGRFLARARAALVWPAGSARFLDEAAEELAARAIESLPGPSPMGRSTRRDEVLDLISYAADALALRREEAFVGHVQWAAGFLARRSVPARELTRTLAALADALAVSPRGAPDDARNLLARARSAMGERA